MQGVDGMSGFSSTNGFGNPSGFSTVNNFDSMENQPGMTHTSSELSAINSRSDLSRANNYHTLSGNNTYDNYRMGDYATDRSIMQNYNGMQQGYTPSGNYLEGQNANRATSPHNLNNNLVNQGISYPGNNNTQNSSYLKGNMRSSVKSTIKSSLNILSKSSNETLKKEEQVGYIPKGSAAYSIGGTVRGGRSGEIRGDLQGGQSRNLPPNEYSYGGPPFLNHQYSGGEDKLALQGSKGAQNDHSSSVRNSQMVDPSLAYGGNRGAFFYESQYSDQSSAWGGDYNAGPVYERSDFKGGSAFGVSGAGGVGGAGGIGGVSGTGGVSGAGGFDNSYGNDSSSFYGNNSASFYGNDSASFYGNDSASFYGNDSANFYGNDSANFYGNGAANFYGNNGRQIHDEQSTQQGTLHPQMFLGAANSNNCPQQVKNKARSRKGKNSSLKGEEKKASTNVQEKKAAVKNDKRTKTNSLKNENVSSIKMSASMGMGLGTSMGTNIGMGASINTDAYSNANNVSRNYNDDSYFHDGSLNAVTLNVSNGGHLGNFEGVAAVSGHMTEIVEGAQGVGTAPHYGTAPHDGTAQRDGAAQHVEGHPFEENEQLLTNSQFLESYKEYLQLQAQHPGEQKGKLSPPNSNLTLNKDLVEMILRNNKYSIGKGTGESLSNSYTNFLMNVSSSYLKKKSQGGKNGRESKLHCAEDPHVVDKGVEGYSPKVDPMERVNFPRGETQQGCATGAYVPYRGVTSETEVAKIKKEVQEEHQLGGAQQGAEAGGGGVVGGVVGVGVVGVEGGVLLKKKGTRGRKKKIQSGPVDGGNNLHEGVKVEEKEVKRKGRKRKIYVEPASQNQNDKELEKKTNECVKNTPVEEPIIYNIKVEETKIKNDDMALCFKRPKGEVPFGDDNNDSPPDFTNNVFHILSYKLNKFNGKNCINSHAEVTVLLNNFLKVVRILNHHKKILQRVYGHRFKIPSETYLRNYFEAKFPFIQCYRNRCYELADGGEEEEDGEKYGEEGGEKYGEEVDGVKAEAKAKVEVGEEAGPLLTAATARQRKVRYG
ncbi:hypothetical protein PCYB_041800 [Plasmodium cynomolgi strain B]|uniref:Uncharacterized protein n=1 Tax=Plasmodium cynomolgi (strain B) TaxID=1120755 RepID=K6UIG4_PLACD|nr:hypothetical protein PCYB_041800 [Plasmodium cynomolgi strain B]GAB64978.1 hypothetical protein PCYB_041800 [Plasmodium cynomolgi strain B]